MTDQARPEPSTLTAQYETLRMAALGEALAPDGRAGLMLFLRRGMWAWANAPVAASAPPQPNCRSSESVAFQPSKVVIQLFAAMAMNANSRSLQ